MSTTRDYLIDSLPRRRAISRQIGFHSVARLGLRIALLAVLTAHTYAQEPERVLVIKAARLIDGTGGPILRNAVVVVRGEKIELVGNQDQVEVPPDAEVIDMGDQTLLPGLIDTQGQLTIRPDSSGQAGIIARMDEDLKGRDMTLAAAHARTSLLSGVTTVRVAGEAEYVDVYLGQAIANETIPGPRIIASGPGLTSRGVPAPLKWKVDTPLDLRKFIRDNLHRGARTMKLKLFDMSPKGSNYTTQELETIVDELKRNGRVVSADVKGLWGVSLKAALQAGVNVIEDPFPLDEEFFPLFLSSNAAISVNEMGRYLFFDDELWSDFDRKVKSLPDWQARLDRLIESLDARQEPDPDWSEWQKNQFLLIKQKKQRQDQLNRARQAGIPITLGLGFAYGGAIQQLEYLVEAGWTPMEAILSGTSLAARVLQLDNYIGTIEEGKYADLIAVRGNPLIDIRDLSQIALVLKQGKRYDGLTFK